MAIRTRAIRTRDCRPIAAILSHPRWDDHMAAMPLPQMLADGVLTPDGLRAADRFFAWAEARGIETLDVDQVLAFAPDTRSAGPFITLLAAMRVLAPGDPALRAIEAAARARERLRPSRRTGGGGRALAVSVPEAALSEPWRRTLQAMRDDVATAWMAAPAPSMVTTIACKLRQLAWSASVHGVAPAINEAALTVYIADLKTRPRRPPLEPGCRPATVLASLRALETFARYTDSDAAILPTLQRLICRWDDRTKQTTKLKEAKMARLPANREIMRKAQKLLDGALRAKLARSAQHRRNAAAALAIFLLIPVRLKDTAWRFGDTLFWNDARYEIDLVISKSGSDEQRYRTPIDPWLTPFIDALVLHGSDPVHVDALRAECIAERRALFIDHNGAECTYGYVSRCWNHYLGTGVHIARSRMHDLLGLFGDHGVRQAMLMCGHVSEGIAQEYQTRAYTTNAIAQAQKWLADELDEAMLDAFPPVTF